MIESIKQRAKEKARDFAADEKARTKAFRQEEPAELRGLM
jgi:hypothetical protein